ncbi:hypothetical protein G7Z17_g5427 [Cylindrodendrum hubeiense]|uniref:Uncharacterized protein n=1 Tax=Cylindrodendrum hubeiense TaxID=595255 RepID=A0A9P5HE67_9HYPO|nr:hypothetical protein G7Z17_g5427 [Cylindrodendrum hubeiense]
MPSTVPTSHPSVKPQAPSQMPHIAEGGELGAEEESGIPADDDNGVYDFDTVAEEESQQQTTIDDSDAETTYSIDTRSDDSTLHHLEVFAERLIKDMRPKSGDSSFQDIQAQYLDSALKEFSWRLHGESSNPFEWEASVVIHRKRKNIIELLGRHPPDLDILESEHEASDWGEEEDDGEELRPEAFRKPADMVMQWVGDLEPPHLTAEAPHILPHISVQESPGRDLFTEEPPGISDELRNSSEDEQVNEDELYPELPRYEGFICESDAYRWLLNKLHQTIRLTIEDADAMMEIGTMIRSQLRTHKSLRNMSSRRPASMVQMTFKLDWNPVRLIRNVGFDFPPREALSKILCLTGSWDETQATTISDYMDQTWPESGKALVVLLQELLLVPEGSDCSYQPPKRRGPQRTPDTSKNGQLTAIIDTPSSCSITVTGGHYLVSEIGEQIGWLASAVQSSPDIQGASACTPRVQHIKMAVHDQETPAMTITGSCTLIFQSEIVSADSSSPGFCWDRLFCNPVLVCGYPILRRPKPGTGLEMPLSSLALITGSEQVVKWGEDILMKGFNMLMIATLAMADIIVWHLVISQSSGERVSYIDPRLKAIGKGDSEGISLQKLKTKRHIIGWCSNAKDLCGDATANRNIKSSGLRKPPASIAIDKLYLEGGADFVAGINMNINVKPKPFWLQRESDYPSLLKWVSTQPVVFYDVEDHRSWLVDGASALLHLTRISLYLDENDPESAYDWVFDATKLKDKWDGCNGRQAALKTLKRWDNLNLNVYVLGSRRGEDGVPVMEYSTLEKRVKKLLLSIEMLIDWQTQTASQDGIHIQQTLDLRHNIVGFDVMDIITPLGPIHPRIRYLSFRGQGWVDLISSIGTTTIFGRGFGDLIRPEQSESVCEKWKSVPSGEDYIATSVSTMQMLYERHFLRMDPDLSGGDVTGKTVWASHNHPFKACAVVFGNLPLLGLKGEGKDKPGQRSDITKVSSASTGKMLQSSVISSVGSTSMVSGDSTNITIPSSGMGQNEDDDKYKGPEQVKKKTKKPWSLKIWKKK